MAQAPDLNSVPEAIDRLPLRGDPTALALIDRAGTMTYAELDAAIGRIASLLCKHGLRPGDRIATWLPKTRVACLMPLAAVRAGLIHMPINPLLKRAQVAHILADSGAAALVSASARIATFEPGDVPAECALIEEDALEAQSDAMPPSRHDPTKIAAILYTSGSTGRPKGVVLSHANLWLGAISVAHYLGLSPPDRTLCLLPLGFDYGQNQLLSTWAAGAAAVPFDYLLPRDVVRAVERFEISVLAGVPPLWTQIVDMNWPPEIAEQLKTITNSGGRLSVPLIRRMRALFPNAALHSMYGLTEAFRSTSLDPQLIDRHPESIGTAIPFAEILVVRPDGSLTEEDEVGELVHAGALVSQGYWNDAERTAQRFRPAPAAAHSTGMAVWSGDKVIRAADGLLRFVGRDDEMIKTAGNRVSPTEIEEAAVSSGVVRQAVAWGAAHETLGQSVMLAVAGAARDEEKLRHYLKKELPNFMQPDKIFWHDSLPLNANGKLDRTGIAKDAL